MKKSILNLLLNLVFLVLFDFKLSANENSHACIASSIQDDYIFLNNLKTLQLDENNLTIEMHGNRYPVRNLQRLGDQWLATFNGYCPRMHPLCECGQCHNPTCYYYIKNCPRMR